jgi:hypothetical protein
MANPNEWGPTLWKIIHICSVHLGNETNILLQKDQINYYNNFTKQIGILLPCKVCRKHYYDYALKHKRVYEYYELKDYSIDYFFNLHNEINKEKDKVLFTKDDFLAYTKYKSSDLTSFIKELESLFKTYILYKYISADALRDFLLSLQKLRSSIRF